MPLVTPIDVDLVKKYQSIRSVLRQIHEDGINVLPYELSFSECRRLSPLVGSSPLNIDVELVFVEYVKRKDALSEYSLAFKFTNLGAQDVFVPATQERAIFTVISPGFPMIDTGRTGICDEWMIHVSEIQPAPIYTIAWVSLFGSGTVAIGRNEAVTRSVSLTVRDGYEYVYVVVPMWGCYQEFHIPMSSLQLIHGGQKWDTLVPRQRGRSGKFGRGIQNPQPLCWGGESGDAH
jgi:hypothetical protein